MPDRDKPRFLISDLCVYLESYLQPDQIQEVYRAYLFSAEAHEGQSRISGEPYIYHPVAVARILADLHMDHKCLMAAILHDVIEDTGTPKEKLARIFDEEIASLVDGVSKLTKIDFKTQAEAQAANIQKMLLAMTKDIRVILIKLADRLHNMRTLGVMRPAKARRIARETLEIYAPIANRLGINSIRLELEDLGFSFCWPMRYRVLRDAVQAARGHRKEMVEMVETAIRQRLEQEGLEGKVLGREKHLYSIYRKMVHKKLSFADVVDVYAFRIIVDKLDTCYRVFGAVHNLYKPVPGRFKDYIAIPKSNGYQSLHTVLFGPGAQGGQGLPIEIQIRTVDMHRLAETGIAAHYLYKSSSSSESPHNSASTWLQNILEMQKDAGDSQEFLEHIKVDLFPDDVYVFTPRGEIRVLPAGATVLDFAYAVHSDVGNTCVAARIDRRMVPLRSRLYNGQTVEVINADGGQPSPAWLNYVVTGKARSNIRAYLKNMQHREAIDFGRRLLDKEMNRLDSSVDEIGGRTFSDFLAESNLTSLDDLLVDIGLGNRMPILVARRLTGAEPRELVDLEPENIPVGQLAIKGTEGMVVKYAKCCRPIPGDPITGVFSAGSGIVVHRHDCRNLGDFQRQGESWLEVRWDDAVETDFPTDIRVEVGNQRGVLATLATTISDTGSNIDSVTVEERDGLTSTVDFILTVKNRKHLARILRRMRRLPAVLGISRQKG